jgi:transmembrane sensor
MSSGHDFTKDWLEGKISPEELKKHKEEGDITVNQYEKLISYSSQMKTPDKLTKQQAWEKLVTRINTQPQPEGKEIKWTRWVSLAIAASVVIALLAYVFVFSAVTVSTQRGERISYVLPDGSEVILNADSKLSFKRIFWSRNRSVDLDGEAFFQVKKGSQFTVTTARAIVTVLGTSFNVFARSERAEVSCFTGKVKVNVKKGDEVILTKGNSTQIENDTLIPPRIFDESKTAAWRSGEFYFESQPMGAVVEELERQFNITIEYHGDATRLYTGYFNTKTLDDALLMVFKPMSLRYHKSGEKKIIVE